jgi:AraC family transcriptional regulator of adaptative response / DNA-3-methyladenine glycosylase II
MSANDTPQQSARYRALCSKDARFDGGFFVGVTSTGIYCRPICRVRTPRQENCRFFDHAAQAEQAGFRPCLRCRPELAPPQRHWSTTDATGILARQACLMLDDPATWTGATTEASRLSAVAARLGVSDRHLRRVFETHLGVSPLQYLQTSRLLAAKQLLADTRMPVADVALTSGFSSLRRFNAAFLAHYRMNPTQMRRLPSVQAKKTDAPGRVRLAWRPPLDFERLMRFLGERQLDGVERFASAPLFGFQRTLRVSTTAAEHTGWITGQWQPDECALQLEVSDGLLKALPSVVRKVRAWFDLDADPAAIHSVLQHDFPSGEDFRVPGCLDGFELAVRAILGQQVTVAAARTIAARLVHRWGDPLVTHAGMPSRLFPTPQALALADEDVMGSIGIVRQRQRAIKSLAQALVSGQIDLNASSDCVQTVQALQALPGIGPWTAQYIAMRALRNPDAWPEGDVAIHKLLGLDQPRSLAARREANRMADAWRPWRSYAVIRIWGGAFLPVIPSQAHTT